LNIAEKAYARVPGSLVKLMRAVLLAEYPFFRKKTRMEGQRRNLP